MPPPAPQQLAAVEPPAAPPAPLPAAIPPAPALSADELEALVTHGDELLATGDISAARLFYERAAQQGSASAATALGKTYDPLFLDEIRARGIRGDAAKAAQWYARASAAGDLEADLRMRRMMVKVGSR
jgi:TPR repeat protein